MSNVTLSELPRSTAPSGVIDFHNHHVPERFELTGCVRRLQMNGNKFSLACRSNTFLLPLLLRAPSRAWERPA